MANNPNPQRETDRALYVALVDWVVKNTLPPPSAYPRVGDGTLGADHVGGDGMAHHSRTRPGPTASSTRCSTTTTARRIATTTAPASSTNVPPPIKRVIPTLVPKVDADGNEIAGVKSLLMRMPLGTYTGWNPTPSGR